MSLAIRLYHAPVKAAVQQVNQMQRPDLKQEVHDSELEGNKNLAKTEKAIEERDSKVAKELFKMDSADIILKGLC